MAGRWLLWMSILALSSLHIVSSDLYIDPPSETDTEDQADSIQGRSNDGLRSKRPHKLRSTEADYGMDPAMMNDPLAIYMCVRPDDWVGLSILSILKVHQMFKTVGAPLAEPYTEGRTDFGPPAPPAAPGPSPTPLRPNNNNNFNPWLPYIMMMQSGGYGHGGTSHGTGGHAGGDSG